MFDELRDKGRNDLVSWLGWCVEGRDEGLSVESQPRLWLTHPVELGVLPQLQEEHCQVLVSGPAPAPAEPSSAT